MPKGVYVRTEKNKHTEATKEKLRLAKLGKKFIKISQAKTGIKRSEETKQKISQTLTSIRRSEETRKKIGLAHLGKKQHCWKGDNVSYRGLHSWVRRHLPQPELCQMCNKTGRLVLANKTGIYVREFKNWFYVCYHCHSLYDNLGKNLTHGHPHSLESDNDKDLQEQNSSCSCWICNSLKDTKV